jgi:hypothetical protein
LYAFRGQALTEAANENFLPELDYKIAIDDLNTALRLKLMSGKTYKDLGRAWLWWGCIYHSDDLDNSKD